MAAAEDNAICGKTIKVDIHINCSFKDIAMRYSSRVKSLGYLKANTTETLMRSSEQRKPLAIAQNDEAKAALRDIAPYRQAYEALALLKILALGNQDVAAGKIRSLADVVARLRAKKFSD
jgi:hypothetical protein